MATNGVVESNSSSNAPVPSYMEAHDDEFDAPVVTRTMPRTTSGGQSTTSFCCPTFCAPCTCPDDGSLDNASRIWKLGIIPSSWHVYCLAVRCFCCFFACYDSEADDEERHSVFCRVSRWRGQVGPWYGCGRDQSARYAKDDPVWADGDNAYQNYT